MKTNQSLIKILEKTMEEMPRVFTSREFNKSAIRKGYPEEIIRRNSGLSEFIKLHAYNNGHGGKTWTKKNAEPDLLFSNDIEFYKEEIEYFIKALKSKGYKVMKPVNEWVEL